MVQRKLSCVWMRCGAACGQGLRTQHSMRMHFLLSAPSLQHIVRHSEINQCYMKADNFNKQYVPFFQASLKASETSLKNFFL